MQYWEVKELQATQLRCFCAEKLPMQQLPLVTEVVLTFTSPVIGWILFPVVVHCGDADWSDLSGSD
jgi:hypothetical protein